MNGWVVLVLLAVSHLVVLGVGCRIRRRREYASGVAAGQLLTENAHGYPPSASPVVRAPHRRFRIRADLQPGPDPLVTRQPSFVAGWLTSRR